jgi:hypothetical protein
MHCYSQEKEEGTLSTILFQELELTDAQKQVRSAIKPVSTSRIFTHCSFVTWLHFVGELLFSSLVHLFFFFLEGHPAAQVKNPKAGQGFEAVPTAGEEFTRQGEGISISE